MAYPATAPRVPTVRRPAPSAPPMRAWPDRRCARNAIPSRTARPSISKHTGRASRIEAGSSRDRGGSDSAIRLANTLAGVSSAVRSRARPSAGAPTCAYPVLPILIATVLTSLVIQLIRDRRWPLFKTCSTSWQRCAIPSAAVRGTGSRPSPPSCRTLSRKPTKRRRRTNAATCRSCATSWAISCWCAATSHAMPRSIRKPRCAKPTIVSNGVSAASKSGWRRKGARRRTPVSPIWRRCGSAPRPRNTGTAPVATTRVDASSPGGDVKGMTALAEQSKRDTSARNPPGGTDANLMSRRHALIQAEKRHAYACAQAQRLPQALALYQKICERDPADAEAWFMLGTLRGRSGDHAGAEAALRQALAVFPEFAQACLNLGHALEVHGNGAEAEACYLRAVALKPDLAEAHEALGRLCQQRGEWPAAEEHYQVALRLHPAATGAALALAALLTRRGRLPDALAALEQAWHHDHTHGELACALARVCLDLDRCEDALHYVRHARRHQPDLVAAHTLEGEILLRRGARAEAEVLLAPLLPRYREHPAIALAHGALSVGSAHACGAVARLEGVLAETALA